LIETLDKPEIDLMNIIPTVDLGSVFRVDHLKHGILVHGIKTEKMVGWED
jgi:hypothetical protein